MKIKALLFAAAAMVGVSAIAQVPASTKVYIDPFEADPGQKVIVDLKVDNPEQPTMSTFQVDLVYPEGILSHAQCTRMEAFGTGNATTLKDGWLISDSFLGANEDEGFSAFTVAFATPSGCDLRIGAFDGNAEGKVFGAQEGAACIKFAIQVAADAAPGEYEISFPHTVVSGPAGSKDAWGPIDPYTVKVTVKGEPVVTGVEDINAKAVAGVKYYNLAGVESNKPFDGVNVVVTTYTDGTKAASKVIK